MMDVWQPTGRARGAARGLCLLCLGALAGCGDGGGAGGGRGDLRVLIEPEVSITDGVPAGDDPEAIGDGWRVSFDRYLVSVGTLSLEHVADGHTRDVMETTVVDLSSLPPQGKTLWTLSDLPSGRWQISYATPGAASADALPSGEVRDADLDAMLEADASYLIEGELSNETGRSCPPRSLATPGDAVTVGDNAGGDPCYPQQRVRFRLAVPAEERFGPCELDGVPGVSVPAGGTRTTALSIHGDHLFFNGFPDGDEGSTLRLAQWFADCDLDLDGEVTEAELLRLAVSDLAELDGRYNLDLPFSDLRGAGDLWSYVQGQLRTQGHLDGEGECAYGGAP